MMCYLDVFLYPSKLQKTYSANDPQIIILAITIVAYQ